MASLFSALRSDLASRDVRYYVLEWLVRNVPGTFGTELRRRVLGRRFARAGRDLKIRPGTRLIGVHGLAVGDHCTIGLENVIQASGGVEIGDNVMLGPGVKIWSLNHVFARTDQPIHEQGYEFKKVVIGNGVWIGAECFITPGAHIGDGVIISAGSVVGGKDIEPYAIVAGNPARKIGVRAERAALHDGGMEG